MWTRLRYRFGLNADDPLIPWCLWVKPTPGCLPAIRPHSEYESRWNWGHHSVNRWGTSPRRAWLTGLRAIIVYRLLGKWAHRRWRNEPYPAWYCWLEAF